MKQRIVADDAIPHLRQAFGEGVVAVRGAEIGPTHLQGADVLLTRSVTRVDRALLEGSHVRFVGSATAGVDHIDLDALDDLGITFAHAPGCNARAVTEYVLTATFGHGEPRGAVGIVGYGQIGRRLAAALRALGQTVHVCDPPRAQAGHRDEDYRSLAELLHACQTVTLHVPRIHDGPHATRHLIDGAALNLLREGSLLINTSRGDVIDHRALKTWLDAQRGEAILDVWEGEPHLDAHVLGHARVRLATPHIAGYTVEGKARGTAMLHAALCEAFDEPLTFTEQDVTGTHACVSASFDDDVGAVLRAVHPLTSIDRATRDLLRIEPIARASAFERLRREYPLRRELSAFEPTTTAAALWSHLR